MTYDPNNVFNKILNGDIPAAKVYESEHVFAFLDISQVTKGHTLVIPKAPAKDVFELPPETAANLFREVPKIANAIKEQFNPIGLNILNNNGEYAGQSVFHYHLHLIPRYGDGDGFGAVWKTHENDYSMEQLQEIATTISEGIKA